MSFSDIEIKYLARGLAVPREGEKVAPEEQR
ncbi:hypothetical protein SDC9_86882 [bioreactor metagenome]|uniref:Uncharacterized protein n=1 Tax=bioreactor metagenome TaxID=1076179 RepID=A0A644ZH67_9ZZZZ